MLFFDKLMDNGVMDDVHSFLPIYIDILN
jgi:hypothetical protein